MLGVQLHYAINLFLDTFMVANELLGKHLVVLGKGKQFMSGNALRFKREEEKFHHDLVMWIPVLDIEGVISYACNGY